MTCLGAVAAALVDGELDHAGRERAQRHVAHCLDCRGEVESQRLLKAQLASVPVAPAPSDALTSRLLGLSGPSALSDNRPDRVVSGPTVPTRAVPDPTVPTRSTRSTRSAPARTVSIRRPAGRPRAQRPITDRSGAASGRRSWPHAVRPRRLGRRTAVGSALLGFGLGAALVLGGPQAQAPSTPLDPGNDTFVTQFVSTTSGGTGTDQ